MLNLEHHIPRAELANLCFEPNLTDFFSEEDLSAIGRHCHDGYQRDEDSRADWLRRSQAGMDLAMQVQKDKTFPWPNCSNIAFPLVTIAALQFHARSYPALFAGPDLVKYRVPGIDNSGQLTQRARIVAKYMNHQCLDLDHAFEEQHDRLLINVPIVGCAFIKTRRNTARKCNESTLVLARDFVIDYYAKSVEGSARKTHIIPLYRNEVYERVAAGTFRDILEEPWYASPFLPPSMPQSEARDKEQGTRPPPSADESTPILFGEQHCWLDLDGDGYSEPYIVMFDLVNKCVVKIAARWEDPTDVEMIGGKVLRINASESFTKYGLIPAPDGSIYDVGFGMLLGPLNESVNTIVNQLTDAGTMSNAAGGFLSRGVKVRGGAVTFSPFGWQRIDSTGDDLRKGIFPLPVREPSQVLFALLQLLINYTQRISGSTDTMTGENPGQNTPANNMNVMVEQGLQVFAATFKRLWRSMKGELHKCFILNARYMEPEVKFGEVMVTRSMFLEDPSNLVPAADPNMVSESQRIQQAVAIKQSAQTTAGYNLQEVELNFLRALRVDGIETLYPGPDKVPPLKNPKVQVEELKTQREQMKLQAEKEQFTIELLETKRLNNAKILQLESQAAKALSEAQGVEHDRVAEQFRLLIDAHKAQNEAIDGRLAALTKLGQAVNDEHQQNQPGGVPNVAPQPGNEGPHGNT